MVLAVNIHPREDGDVEAFITGHKYGFIPLRIPDEKWLTGIYNIRATPTNYLIGPDGQLYGKPQIYDKDLAHTLGLLVEGLLNQAKSR